MFCRFLARNAGETSVGVELPDNVLPVTVLPEELGISPPPKLMPTERLFFELFAEVSLCCITFVDVTVALEFSRSCCCEWRS